MCCSYVRWEWVLCSTKIVRPRVTAKGMLSVLRLELPSNSQHHPSNSQHHPSNSQHHPSNYPILNIIHPILNINHQCSSLPPHPQLNGFQLNNESKQRLCLELSFLINVRICFRLTLINNFLVVIFFVSMRWTSSKSLIKKNRRGSEKTSFQVD